MLEGLKEALQYVVNLGNDAEKVQVLEICGETYANKKTGTLWITEESQCNRGGVPVCYGGLYCCVF